MELDICRKDDAIDREMEGRKRLMQTLQGYKDEVDTLNEALRIAAMDVAMVAEEEDEEEMDLDLDSDLDLEEESHQDDEERSDLDMDDDDEDEIDLADESDENNVYDLKFQAEAKGPRKEGNAIRSNSKTKNGNPSQLKGAFYVNEDGSFNYK